MDIKQELQSLQELREKMLGTLQQDPNPQRAQTYQDEFNKTMGEYLDELHAGQTGDLNGGECECGEESEGVYSKDDFMINLDFSTPLQETGELSSQSEKNLLEVKRQDELLAQYSKLLVIE